MKEDTHVRKVASVRVALSLWKRIEKAAKREQMSVADWHRDVLLSAVRQSEQARKAS
jgi:hypothetical protein